MKGYKATDKNMKCRGFQFELGRWYEHEGALEECKSGFHFCDHPSGPWFYYGDEGTRIFEVEAEGVLDESSRVGADVKRVCRRIKLVREIEIDGNRNSGDYNSGDYNSGYYNSGTRNSGHYNSGNYNSGHCNSGNYNSGHCNSGTRNSGHCNSGNYNSGTRNSGYYNSGTRNSGTRNSGHCNSGNYNSGNRNSGDYNATNYSSGFFCLLEQKVISFDVQTKLTRDDYQKLYPETYNLGCELLESKEIDFEKYKNIPGITKKKLAALHKKHLEARKK